MVLAFVCLCIAIGIAATAQDDDVRGAFLTSRPKVSPANTARRRNQTEDEPKRLLVKQAGQATGEEREAGQLRTIV